MTFPSGNLSWSEQRGLWESGGLTLLGLFLGFLVAGPAVASAQRTLLDKDTSPYKGFSGIRVDPGSMRGVYYCGQTIAVVESERNNKLINCELIEVYNSVQKKDALFNLTRISKPRRISFPDMMDLMMKCDQLNSPNIVMAKSFDSNEARGTTDFPIFSGVLPGTKWCGAGDLASTFFDLGEEEAIDRCCRLHDLCPIKVKSQQTRYNLINNSIYTKSHCQCDMQFRKCLKAQNHLTANLMGNIYFNVLRVPCVQISGNTRGFEPPTAF